MKKIFKPVIDYEMDQLEEAYQKFLQQLELDPYAKEDVIIEGHGQKYHIAFDAQTLSENNFKLTNIIQ
jgi:hypothetical protein